MTVRLHIGSRIEDLPIEQAILQVALYIEELDLQRDDAVSLLAELKALRDRPELILRTRPRRQLKVGLPVRATRRAG